MDRFDEPEIDRPNIHGKARVAVLAERGGKPVDDRAVIQMYTLEQRLAAKGITQGHVEGLTLHLCPHCVGSFETAHGLKIHVGRAHGDVSDAN